MTAQETSPETVRETVAVFHDAEELENAVMDLETSGFDRADISLLAGEATIEEKFGHVYRRQTDAEDDPDAPRTAFVSSTSLREGQGLLAGMLGYVGAVAATGAMVATGGSVAAAAAAAAVGGAGSGLIGTGLAKWIGSKRASFLQEQIDKGGVVLWVRTPDEKTEARAREALARHGADDLHVHDLPASP